ncbi:hypothetical protein B7L39_07895 [Acinetobacter baumannii]|nr:hypothetical protein B7L39_07895 [Acinetobacter baumannii]
MILRHNNLCKSILLILLSGGCLNIPNTVFAGDLPPPPRDINEINQLFKLYLCTRQISQNPYPIRVLPS